MRTIFHLEVKSSHIISQPATTRLILSGTRTPNKSHSVVQGVIDSGRQLRACPAAKIDDLIRVQWRGMSEIGKLRVFFVLHFIAINSKFTPILMYNFKNVYIKNDHYCRFLLFWFIILMWFIIMLWFIIIIIVLRSLD